ncbi:MAG: protease SohB [Pseudomonadota bacterium]
MVVAVGAIIVLAAGASRRQPSKETIKVEKLNDRFRNFARQLRQSVDPAQEKALIKAEKQRRKDAKKTPSDKPRTFVIDFKGDIRAQAVSSLREEVSAILDIASDEDSVIVRLENPGGVVHEHGLAAAQLIRLRDAGLTVQVVVDKVAASGGYLMACVAHEIVAAPFGIVGSIGVITQVPNFHRLLDDKGVEFEQVTAGKYKRTVTMFGKNTDADRAKLKEELEDVHTLFKDVVSRYRPDMDLERVATGEHWYGTQALELGLIDRVDTSDALLVALFEERDVFSVRFESRPPLPQRVMEAVENSVVSSVERVRDTLSHWWPHA